MVTIQVQAKLLILFDKLTLKGVARDRGAGIWRKRDAHSSQPVKTDIR
jgi:hypothetical protein